MRAVQYAEAGGPEVIRVTEGEDPVPSAGQVLIEVAAAGSTAPMSCSAWGSTRRLKVSLRSRAWRSLGQWSPPARAARMPSAG